MTRNEVPRYGGPEQSVVDTTPIRPWDRQLQVPHSGKKYRKMIHEVRLDRHPSLYGVRQNGDGIVELEAGGVTKAFSHLSPPPRRQGSPPLSIVSTVIP